MSRNLALAITIIAAAGIASAVAASCSEPGSGDDAAADAGQDVRVDAGADSAADASAGVCDAGSTDGSDWAGWHRFTGGDSCCLVDVPDDPTSAMLPLDWVACANGLTACSELNATWSLDPLSPYRFGTIKMTADSNGNPKWLWFTRNLSTLTVFEDDLYDVSAGQALAAWRSDTAPKPSCILDTAIGSAAVALLEEGPSGVSLTGGNPTAMMSSPAFAYVGSLAAFHFQDVLASDAIVGWDVEPDGVIARGELPSGPSVGTTKTGGTLQLLLALVAGSDVFASSTHGTSGYGQIYLVHSDGTSALFRANPSAHISAMRTDGTSLFWSETYGSTDISAVQQRVEVWTAPYTNDASTLSATAAKVAVLPAATPYVPGEAISFNGLYATRPGGNDAIVARLTDGKTTVVSAGPNRYFWRLAFVSSTELWATVANGNKHGSALVRIQIPAW